MIKEFYRYWGKVILFWLLFFVSHRVIFILFNHSYIQDTSFSNLLLAFFHGGRLDLSIVGYMMLLIVLAQIISIFTTRKYNFQFITGFSYIMIVLLGGLLLSDTYLFSYWGRHLDSEAISFLETPDVILRSLEWYQSLGCLIVLILISSLFIATFKRWVRKPLTKKQEQMGWRLTLIQLPLLLFIGSFLILPIRGGVGVAPINTGAAYFSSERFANQAALNPIWNLMYSLKKLDATKRDYHFMNDSTAQKIFMDLKSESGQYESLISKEKPNVVVILLESFAAHVIEPLGGHAVTPNFTKLCKEGVLFTNIYAASMRSDMGLVATIAGYPVLPSYSIIRYPNKTESLSFLPARFNDANYQDIMYMYGGDMGFKNMQSFVTQAGFKRTISMSDFPSQYQGEKWGVHDQYAFERLADEMQQADQPFFHFFFTLSSHEPFDVPMERVYENDYHNSINYTDKCLGEFIQRVKENGLWDNTLLVLIADHGVGGPEKFTLDTKNYNHIPMLLTGGALAVKDTLINKIGSQTDMARTLLCQLGIDDKGFPFSKNLLDEGQKGFAFFDYPDAMGIIEDSLYQVFDNQIGRFLHMENAQNQTDSLKAKAYLQMLSLDHKKR